MRDLTQAASTGTVYDKLSDAEKSEIDAALAELDRGQGVPWSSVADELGENRVQA